uniref:Hook C-terminal domain-containing protein n=1 Tax=Phytophthora ramorum TaxID=164328 RepID=H3GUN2_PHYRM
MQDGGTEATSLMRWLGFYAATDQEQCVVIVGRLLDTAFPAAFAEENMLRGWEAVMATLEGFYEASVGLDVRRLADAVVEPNETLRTVLELVLGAVVQCEKKDQFVKDILTMEDAVQADLMSIIERVMARGVSVVEESREGRVGVMGQTEMQEKEQKTQSSDKQAAGMGSPLYLSRNAALEQTKRENGVLKEENVHLARELDATTKTFREVEDEKLKLVEMVRQLKEQLGSDVLRKERLKALQRELDHAKAELQDKTALATKVPALQDEVDLLRPLADKMAKMDTTVAKYKAKIDELSGAKDTLRSLEGTNAELMEMNLALESKLAKAASWHRKLKEAKEANTAVSIRA